MKCQGSSEKRERMMDLTVPIEGNIITLEDALAKFTSTEILDGDNKYQCDRYSFIIVFSSFPLFVNMYLVVSQWRLVPFSLFCYTSCKHIIHSLFGCRCKSYERARKKMTILEAPNVLTIALKRYQAQFSTIQFLLLFKNK
jgi:ubiquitin carboxyl-terminal hydrolase 36/42